MRKIICCKKVQNEKTRQHIKDDETAFLMEHNVLGMHKTNSVLIPFFDSLWQCYGKYREEFSILDNCEHHGVKAVRLQKTCPGQGYHSWHFESATSLSANRLLAFSLYLNDVDEGGETEFLYMKKRIQPKAGRLIIWPAGFTHTHRGNPPLSNEKYILTGWIEYMGVV